MWAVQWCGIPTRPVNLTTARRHVPLSSPNNIFVPVRQQVLPCRSYWQSSVQFWHRVSCMRQYRSFTFLRILQKRKQLVFIRHCSQSTPVLREEPFEPWQTVFKGCLSSYPYAKLLHFFHPSWKFQECFEPATGAVRSCTAGCVTEPISPGYRRKVIGINNWTPAR